MYKINKLKMHPKRGANIKKNILTFFKNNFGFTFILTANEVMCIVLYLNNTIIKCLRKAWSQ